MYKVKTPILGFENYFQVKIESSSEFLSTIIFDEEEFLSIHIANAKFLKNMSFNLPDEILTSLEISDDSSYEIYFTILIQDPINKSVLNLSSPIIINKKSKLISQFVTNNKANFKSIQEASIL